MKKVKIDVMILGGDKFYCTIAYFFNPLFKFDFTAAERYVYDKCPTLKNRKDVVLVYEEI